MLRKGCSIFAAALALGLLAGCEGSSAPMHIERGIGVQSGFIPDRTSLSKPYLIYGHIGFRTPGQLEEHFDKHGSEFHAVSPTQFLEFAQDLRDRPKDPTILEGTRFDGVKCRLDTVSGAFIAVDKNRTIRTFFKPANGKSYYLRQLKRTH